MVWEHDVDRMPTPGDAARDRVHEWGDAVARMARVGVCDHENAHVVRRSVVVDLGRPGYVLGAGAGVGPIDRRDRARNGRSIK